MSMLSAQCDELRAMAESVGLAMPQAATLMMDAADTIWELRCRLVDAEDRVRKLGELCKLCEREAENAKLREALKLAAFVLETMEHVTSWRFEGDGKVFDSTYFYDYLHELEVEL